MSNVLGMCAASASYRMFRVRPMAIQKTSHSRCTFEPRFILLFYLIWSFVIRIIIFFGYMDPLHTHRGVDNFLQPNWRSKVNANQ